MSKEMSTGRRSGVACLASGPFSSLPIQAALGPTSHCTTFRVRLIVHIQPVIWSSIQPEISLGPHQQMDLAGPREMALFGKLHPSPNVSGIAPGVAIGRGKCERARV